MIVQHNSIEKIEKVEKQSLFFDDSVGCLCFAEEGHSYNLAGEVNYSYLIDVDNILDISRIWFEHDSEEISIEVEEVIEEIMSHCECDRDCALNYIDDSLVWGSDWFVQQRQGLIAHLLGYDCAESEDEQGVVYVAYCVNREMEEVKQ